MSGGFEIKLRHRLGDFTLDVDLTAGSGVTALFGPSGAGKTSVIRAVAGLLRPDEGVVRLGDRTLVDTTKGVFLKPHQRRVGYVFQDARLFPHMSVAQNLVYGAPKDTDVSGELIDLLGIKTLLDREPKDLSGGEAQRVAIGRALLSNPAILLLDEPLAALDQIRRDEILPYLDQLTAVTGVPMLYVSHAMSEVARLADRIVLMREGRVVRAGDAADILSDPALVPEIGVREAGAVLTATVETQDLGDGLSALRTSLGTLYLPKVAAPEGARLRVRILASDIIISKDRPDGLSALNVLPSTVAAIQEGAGPGAAIALRSGDDRLVARVTRRSARALKLAEGSKCFAVIKSVSVAPGNIGRGAEV